MTQSTEKELNGMYCALVAKENREDPIGTAATHERYLFVEVPLPWGAKAEESKHFPAGLTELLKQLADHGVKCRLQPFTSDDAASPPGRRRIMYYERPARSFAYYEKIEYSIPDEQLLALVEAILLKHELVSFAPYKEATEDIRDIFVCTHGSRDRCCGKFAYPIYQTIKAKYAAKDENKLRVWRASHIGGHRHAPTMIDMPEGRYWAQVTAEILDTLILRQGDVATLSKHYRGWGGVHKLAQAAERALFIQEGWKWITYDKEATLLQEDDAAATVQIDYRSQDGAISATYEAEITTTKTVKTGGCGSEPKDVKQFEVSRLVKC